MHLPIGNWGGGYVWRVTGGEFPSNAYLCGTGGGSCVLIDGGLNAMVIDQAMRDLSLTPTAMFCTHGHFDHAGAAAYFQEKFGLKVYLHGADQKILRGSNFLLMAFKLRARIEQPSDIVTVSNGQSINVGAHKLTFHGAPGHTPGSTVIEFGSALFTGDTIYARGVGLSHLPGEDPALLRKSIVSLIPLLTADRVIFPGHGGWVNAAEVLKKNIKLQDFLNKPECLQKSGVTS